MKNLVKVTPTRALHYGHPDGDYTYFYVCSLEGQDKHQIHVESPSYLFYVDRRKYVLFTHEWNRLSRKFYNCQSITEEDLALYILAY